MLMTISEKLVIFDLDGTLNRTELFAVEVHRMVQAEFGWPSQTPEEIISTFGAPAKECLDALLPGADEETKQRYNKRASEVEYEYIHLADFYTGVPEMLDSLHEMGFGTAVCSNASYRYISMVLEAIGIMDKIDFIQPLEKGMTNKGQSLCVLLQGICPSFAVMVGDTAFDMEAANANNIPFIGCTYGFRPQEMEQASFAVDSPVLIPKVVRSIAEM